MSDHFGFDTEPSSKKPDAFNLEDYQGKRCIGCDFKETKGLREDGFRGADLRGAVFPEGFSFENIAQVNQLSAQFKNLSILILTAVAFTFANSLAFSDEQLVLETGTVPLLLINVPVPVKAYAKVLPFLLLGLHLGFHLRLQQLWRPLSQLPTYFPNGDCVFDRVHIWAGNDIIRIFFPVKRISKVSLWEKTRFFLTIFLLWWVLPLSMVWHHYVFLPTQKVEYGFYAMTGFLLSLSISAFSYLRMQVTLTCDERPNWGGVVRGFCFFSFVVIVVGYMSCQTYQGRPPKFLCLDLYKSALSKEPVNARILPADELAREVKECDFAGRSLRFANLEHANLTYGKLKDIDLTGARLVKTNLRFADMRAAVLIDACLDEALLRGAVMDGAKLPGGFKPAELPASMFQVSFERVHFDNVVIEKRHLSKPSPFPNDQTKLEMRETNFSGASGRLTLKSVLLQSSHFQGARFHDNLSRELKERALVLEDVVLDDSDFQGAAIKAFFSRVSLVGITGKDVDFSESIFSERCYFINANLPKANFSRATFQQAVFDRATLYGANFDDAILKKVSFRNAGLQNARFVKAKISGQFQYADLTGADFSEAVLSESNFHGANLKDVHFQGADLRYCTGITKEQWAQLVLKDDATKAPLVLE